MRYFLLNSATLAILLQLSAAEEPALVAMPKQFEHNTPSVDDEAANKDNYTINFNNVSIIEYIRFVSKITNLNFVFNEADLQFTVTIVSEEPVTARNILSILIQVLRIHNLSVLEQDSNLLITSSRNVNQIATIVAGELPDEPVGNVPLVTRVFRIKNANLNTVASVIRPMLSQSALVEVSNETRQLIVTDITTNIDKISTLLVTLDTPHTSLEIDSYVAKNTAPKELVSLSTQLLSPFAEGNPIIFVPQEGTNTIFIVSTPHLIERALAILEDLDTPTKGEVLSDAHGEVFIYKLKYVSGDIIQSNLKNIAENLKEHGAPNQDLLQTINSTKWLQDNNSLLITGSPASIEQVKQIIQQFDFPGGSIQDLTRTSFYIYRPISQSPQVIQSTLQDIGKDLEAAGFSDTDFILTLKTMRYVETTNTLLFTGSPASIDKLKELLSRIDVLSSEDVQIQQMGQLTFFIYRIQYISGAQLMTRLKGLATDLRNSGAIDSSVVESIDSMKYIKETNSILFTGPAETLQKIELMIKKFDIPSLAQRPEGPMQPPETFVVYTPKYQTGDELVAILREFEENLAASGFANKNLFDTINNLKWISKTCSLLISGDQESILKVEDLLRRFDVPTKEITAIPPSIESIENTSFLIYKLQYHQGMEILTALKQIAVDISKTSTAPSQSLLTAINSLQWIRVTNSILASGEADTLAKIRELIQNLDIPLRQVFIEVLVLETSLTNTQNFGLQWGGKMQYLNRVAAGSGNFPLTAPNSTTSTNNQTINTVFTGGINAANATTPPSSTNIPFLTGFDLGVIGDIIMHKGKSFISLGSLVNALQTDTDSSIIMNPKIITQDNRNSSIFVGNNIPFIGSLVTLQANQSTTSSNIEYRDIGFNLSITPTIGNSDVVTLEINNDISALIGPPQQGTATQTVTGLQTSHTSMSTRVHVPNKHFVVLSGMIQDTKTHFKSQIPCLGGLPVIGIAFSENDRINSKQNIIIFVRPHIINTYEEYKLITTHQEDLYKEQAGLSILKEEFDAGIDVVKTPENE